MMRTRSRLGTMIAVAALPALLAVVLMLTLSPPPASAQDPTVDIGSVTDVTLAPTTNDHELLVTWKLQQTACKAIDFSLFFRQEGYDANFWEVHSLHAGNPSLKPDQTSTDEETYTFTMTKLTGGVAWGLRVNAYADDDDAACSDTKGSQAYAETGATPLGTGTPEGRDPNVKGPNRPWIKLYPGNGQILVTFGVYDDPDLTDDDVINWNLYAYDGLNTTGPNAPLAATATSYLLTGLSNDTEYEIAVGAVGQLDTGKHTTWNYAWQRDRFDPDDDGLRIDRSTPGASPPAFAGTDDVADQTFTQGTAITALQLPTISDTGVTYELHPLPAGLSVSESGELSGTPTAPQGVTTHIWSVIKNGLTDTIAFTIGIKPKAPENLAARGLDGKVELTWTAIAGVTGWQYQQGSGTWNDISGNSDATSHTVTGLTNDT